MKPPPFRYSRPESLDEAIELLQRYGDEAKPLAGGQSLLPMMNFRLARPGVLVDLERVPDLDAISVTDQGVTIGAMARQARVGTSTIVADRVPLLVEALHHVGHHQIRTRGTVGGSLAHGDPAAELPAIAILLDAEIHVRGPRGVRTVPANAFWQAPYTTDLSDDEILTAVHFPADAIEVWSFNEIARRGGDFAIAGLASVRMADGVRLVGFGVGWVPLRLKVAERAWREGDGDQDAMVVAAAAAYDEVDPVTDVHADATYRREILATLVRRSLAELAA